MTPTRRIAWTPITRWLVLALLLAPACVWAKVEMAIDAGWAGFYKPGKWTPLLVTVKDSQAGTAPRNVRLVLTIHHDFTYSMRIVRDFALTGQSTTHVVYVPLQDRKSGNAAVLIDMQTGKRLAELSMDPTAGGPDEGFGYQSPDTSDYVIGVTGRGPALGSLSGRVNWAFDKSKAGTPSGESAIDVGTITQTSVGETSRTDDLQIGFLPSRFLPDFPQGYDALDMLVLNGPDLSRIDRARQGAIADWVRSGGALLVWPGETPFPPDGPLVEALPCRIGPSKTLDVTLKQTRERGLLARVEKVPAWNLEPAEHAQRWQLPLAGAELVVGHVGLGRVAVSNIDLSALLFEQPATAQAFYGPTIQRLLDVRPRTQNRYSGYYRNHADQTRAAAVEEVVDRLGNAPGVGRFDFGYVAIIMAALMFVVGPIDWFVLKKLGRQPWTWATTTGWLLLVTVGALLLGRIYKSGDLHYRSVRLIQEADGKVASTLDMVGLYSPRTQEYGFEVPRDGWWQPTNIYPNNVYQRSRVLPTGVDFVQRQGNLPTPVQVNIWSLHFMEGRGADASSISPTIGARLRVVDSPGGPRLFGTLTNTGTLPLRSIRVRTAMGLAWDVLGKAATLGPGATVEVDVAVVAPAGVLIDSPDPNRLQSYPWSDSRPFHIESGRIESSVNPAIGNGLTKADLDELAFVRAVCDLDPEATGRIERRVFDEPRIACVYAVSDDPTPPVKLAADAPGKRVEEHWRIFRAVIRLNP